jgi:acetoacetate decarboxylase
MHYKNPDGLKDLAMIRETLTLAGYPGALAALGRSENDLDTLTEALDLYGIHKVRHGCLGKKHQNACNCGLDNRRQRAGLPRTLSKNGPTPYPRDRR